MQLAGYLTGVMGTGEHARQLAMALRAQGIRLTATTLHGVGALEDEALAPGESPAAADDAFADVNLLCVNADSVPGVAAQLGPGFFAGRYTIGFWAWEVGAFPARFEPAFDHLDEVWVGSRHVRDAVAPAATVPVVAIPQPVSLRDGAAAAPPPPELPEGFRFLFAFDHLSVFQRKNPLAAVEAFVRAFPPGEGAVLIVKALNPDHDPAAQARLRAAAAGHPDVHLLEHRLAADERDGLMAAADCYVSLHRAEGFGYTLAESMWLGKPVIATGYSGNLDFMTPDNSYLVAHRLVPIGPGSEPYPPDGVWAEPDVDDAARLMRHVFEDREEARRRGERAAADIRLSHGPEAAGAAMRARLERVVRSPGFAARGRRVAATADGGVDAARLDAARLDAARIDSARLADRIRSGPVPPARARFGEPQRLARRALLRVLKPLAVHQALVDGELLAVAERLDGRLDALAASQQETRQLVEDLRGEVRALRDGAAPHGPS